MPMNPRQFWRMSKWARNPPSARRVKLVLGAIVIAFAIAGLGKLFGTPEWMKLNDIGRGPQIIRQ